MESGKVMGYARVSSTEQNLDRQIMALSEYVPEDCIVVDKASGKNLERPGYQQFFEKLSKSVFLEAQSL